MQRILLNEDIHPLSEFRANVAAFIDKVRQTKRPLLITQHGKSAAVMLDVAEYEKLLQKLELLTDIQIAESQIERGEDDMCHPGDRRPGGIDRLPPGPGTRKRETGWGPATCSPGLSATPGRTSAARAAAGIAEQPQYTSTSYDV